jgi:hypothetical protein
MVGIHPIQRPQVQLHPEKFNAIETPSQYALGAAISVSKRHPCYRGGEKNGQKQEISKATIFDQ